ncbi:MAG: hypothetical protein PHS93_03720 [Candidatus Omnitrophica bacterium]|nr:hypothetical protein [Candidatus Omnitrophota bacterium]MDD5352260.1 hypothetical protein [Candidatus Omnitrophota bacterium]MDD5549858.1 hypothetical protein [Candidatus Omnitrophota bacterium]
MKKIFLITLVICVSIMVFTSLCLAGWEEDSEKATLEDEAAHLMRIEKIKGSQDSSKYIEQNLLYRPVTEFLTTQGTKGVINENSQNDDAITAPDAMTITPSYPPPPGPNGPGGNGENASIIELTPIPVGDDISENPVSSPEPEPPPETGKGAESVSQPPLN